MDDRKCSIACDLGALTGEERARRSALASAFARSVVGRSEIADGFEFHLKDDEIGLRELGEWIALERRCCPFLRFRIDLEPASNQIRLSMGGADGVKEFLRHELTR